MNTAINYYNFLVKSLWRFDSVKVLSGGHE